MNEGKRPRRCYQIPEPGIPSRLSIEVQEMREDSSFHDKMIHRNWVLKRKRKKISSAFDVTSAKEGPSMFSEFTNESSSLRKKFKGGDNGSQCSQKIKGHDGYYFECEQCDLGGNLLCCDNCPRTYHIECLDPPLKHAPAGKWLCPKCCNNKVDKWLSNTETTLRGTTTKTAVKTMAGHSISCIDKISHSGESFHGKSESAAKEKAGFVKKSSDSLHLCISAIARSSLSGDNVLKNGLSTIDVCKMKKQAVSPPHAKKSVHKTVHSLVKLLNPHPKDKSTKKKPYLCKNKTEGKMFGIPLVITSQLSKRSRKKINTTDKISPQRASLLSHGPAKISDKMISYHDLFHDIPQVHRILGCRVKTESSCTSQSTGIITSKADKKAEKKAGKKSEKKAEKKADKKSESASVHTVFPFCDFTSEKNLDQVDCFDDNEVVDVKLGHAMDKDFHVDANLIAQKISGSSIELDKIFTDKMCKTNENIDKEEGPLTLMSEPSQVHCTDHEELRLGDDCAGDTNARQLTSKKHVVESIHTAVLCAENHNEHHILRPADLPVNFESQEFCSYDFFVKWAGKSNIHNTWVSEDELKVLAKRKLENYKAKWGVSIINLCEKQWCLPQRIISIHESENGGGEALVKWFGLPYDECTWERLDEPVIKNSSHLVSELKQFESQTVDKDDIADIVRTDIRKIAPLVEQPKELKGGSLFPHQLEALNWLRKCWHKSKNVILADEMGLGKTVSACSFISSLFFEFKVKLPCLVLVPLSTMPNWQAEFASWAPHLNIVEYHGSAKARSVIRHYEWHASDAKRLSKLSKEYKFNVLLTTYEMILADYSHLRGVPWEVLIVDEGHRLKNSESKLFNLLNTFSFQQRVLLTGTPLQNNLGEMYNLLNFLQPCSFPSLSLFEEKFNDLSTAEKVEELKKLVAPHMLRRLKKDAMQDIPPKSERLVPVELTSIQAEYYRAMLTKNYQILRNVGKGVAQQSMLNIVMQLRKVCNHPYLIPGTEPESSSLEFLQEMRIKASAKLTLLHAMLKILHKEHHRVLIFSQMTKLLDILEDYLTIEFGLGAFERVDGSVSVANRQAAITRFNQDKTRFVFLLSTRSCGLGINLATADTVIIYDSDFNPHADIQAMNRAHRIGQSNRLLVYILVVRASVEERILQLAKKKLMLDQLFVNKFGSQKEVEDILRWGTEELFSDSDGGNFLSVKIDCHNNVTATDGELKHKRRPGGLGDIYKDRCTDVGNKITWDENAILKLLDRSNLQSGISDNDGDLENGMLGAVKPLDSNEEPINEEPGNNEMSTNLSGDGLGPSREPEEDDKNTLMEENKWDKLLRVRWEKYQVEEEAALGRGKRLRKVISYKETFASVPNEALNESVNEEEEPKREYTPAGRALKEKFLKLRARQKERIAGKLITVIPSIERPGLSTVKGHQVNDPNHKQTGDLSVNQEEVKCSQPLRTNNSDGINGHASKNGHKKICSVTSENSSDVISQSNHFHKTCSVTSLPSSCLSPVLGLCAPNASQIYSASRIFRTPASKQKLHHEQKESAIDLPQFLSSPAKASVGIDTHGEALDPCSKDFISDYFPFDPPPPPTLRKCLSDLGGSSGATSNLDDEFPMKFPFLPGSSFKEGTDISPSLSLHTNMEFASVCRSNLSNAPVMPDFPPVLDLGAAHMPHTSQMLSNNHKKVLDNIMMRTRTAAHKFWKKRLKVDVWSEDELDALWIGVRRHGRGNWDAMFRDPKLKILRHKSIDELSSKWNEEQCKILDVPAPFPKIPNFASSLFPGTMTQVLPGSKFSSIGQEPPVSHSHLSDIKLSCGDLLPKFWSLGKSNQPVGKFGMLNRPEKISLTSDQLAHQNPVPGGFFGASGIILPNLLDGARDIHCGESTKNQVSGKQSVDDGDFPGSSRANELPHWLQKAVNVSLNPTESELSQSASAIMHSIRVLYDEVEPKIPPFVVLGPPPFLPKDPQKISRNRRKLDRDRRAMSDASCSESIGYNSSALLSLPPLMGSSIPLEQRNLSPPLSSLNLNLNSPSKDVPFPTFSDEKCEIPASNDPDSSRPSEDDLNTKQKAPRSSDLDHVNLDSRNAESDSWRGVDVEEVLENSSEEACSDQICEGS